MSIYTLEVHGKGTRRYDAIHYESRNIVQRVMMQTRSPDRPSVSSRPRRNPYMHSVSYPLVSFSPRFSLSSKNRHEDSASWGVAIKRAHDLSSTHLATRSGDNRLQSGLCVVGTGSHELSHLSASPIQPTTAQPPADHTSAPAPDSRGA